MFSRKVNYWSQTVRLPKKTLRKIRLIGYCFMWDGRKGSSWSKITQSKEDGGLGMHAFMLIDEAMTIKEAISLWEGLG